MATDTKEDVKRRVDYLKDIYNNILNKKHPQTVRVGWRPGFFLVPKDDNYKLEQAYERINATLKFPVMSNDYRDVNEIHYGLNLHLLSIAKVHTLQGPIIKAPPTVFVGWKPGVTIEDYDINPIREINEFQRIVFWEIFTETATEGNPPNVNLCVTIAELQGVSMKSAYLRSFVFIIKGNLISNIAHDKIIGSAGMWERVISKLFRQPPPFSRLAIPILNRIMYEKSDDMIIQQADSLMELWIYVFRCSISDVFSISTENYNSNDISTIITKSDNENGIEDGHFYYALAWLCIFPFSIRDKSQFINQRNPVPTMLNDKQLQRTEDEINSWKKIYSEEKSKYSTRT